MSEEVEPGYYIHSLVRYPLNSLYWAQDHYREKKRRSNFLMILIFMALPLFCLFLSFLYSALVLSQLLAECDEAASLHMRANITLNK